MNSKMTFEEAKAKVQQLNSLERVRQSEERQKARALARQSNDHRIKSAFLPELDVTEFEQKILFKKFSRDQESLKFRRFLSHWVYVQKMIAELELDPSDYHEDCHLFYQYFEEKQTSPDYANKLLRMVNAWGYFYCRKMSKPFLGRFQ